MRGNVGGSGLSTGVRRKGGLTVVAEVDELLGEQVGEQLHDEQQVLVLVLLGRGVAALPALVVFGVDLQQRQAGFVQLHGLSLRKQKGYSVALAPFSFRFPSLQLML